MRENARSAENFMNLAFGFAKILPKYCFGSSPARHKKAGSARLAEIWPGSARGKYVLAQLGSRAEPSREPSRLVRTLGGRLLEKIRYIPIDSR